MLRYDLYHNDLPDGLQIKTSSLAIDTEAMGLAIKRDRLCLVQMCDDAGNLYLVKFDGSDYSAPNLSKLLNDASIRKIFHFARFDVGILQHYLGVRFSNLCCTKIASKLVRTYTDFHGLKSLVRDLLGVDLNKEQGTSNWGATTLTPAQIKYACNDVIYLHRLIDSLETRLHEYNRYHIAQKCWDMIPTICDMDLLGFSEGIFSHNATR